MSGSSFFYPEFVVPNGDKPKLPLDKAIMELNAVYHSASKAKACAHAGADLFVEWYNSAADVIALVYGNDSHELEYLRMTNFGGYNNVSEADRQTFQEGMKRITTALADWIRALSTLDSRKQMRRIALVRNNRRSVYDSQEANKTLEVKLSSGLKVRTAFDEYILGPQIGQGGNGRVFEGSSSDGRQVAIKFIDQDNRANKLRRFKNEIKFCEQHKHPNIVKILDHGYFETGETDYSFYVMPLYGKSLRKRIDEGLTPKDAIEIFKGILSGLKEAHSHHVIHRDIKPENIMLKEGSNIPVICDFGIAHIPEEYMATIVVTKQNERMANWGYAAPEQKKKGGEACFQSDVYAAALILNEMFTGEVPVAPEYKRIGDVSPDYSYLDDVFSALYRQNPDDRLYPEDRIFAEMRVRAEINNNSNAIAQLTNTTENIQTDIIKCPHIISKSYKNGVLSFEFDIPIPREWLEILNEGSFDHNSVMGYDVNCVVMAGDRVLQLNVRGLDVGNIKIAVECFYEWVTIVNAKYTNMLTVRYANKRREGDAQRKREIARLEEEKRIQVMLSKM